MGETQAPLLTDFELVCSRLRDFFARNAPWHRRLWSIGTVLRLREVLEYADGCLTGRSPSTEGLNFVVGSASREVGRDPGVAHLATEIESLLQQLRVDSPKDLSRHVCAQLEQLARRADGEYCERWRDAGDDVPVEFASRAFASHLLDSGLSSEHLYRWLQATASSLSTVPELAEEAAGMMSRTRLREYEVFVPCSAPYDKPAEPGGSVKWLDGSAAAEWLKQQIPQAEPRRHSGGFLIIVERRDPWAAVDAAQALVARVDARARVARLFGEGVRMNGWARVAVSHRSYRIDHLHSHVEIGSLDRQRSVYSFDAGLPIEVDDALELASYMKSPNVGAAVIGAWSAVEALLIRPTERSKHHAADRLAALVACSLPRAELTPLAYRHTEAANDQLAAAIQAADTNYAKVRHVEGHLRSGGRLALTDGSEIAAQDRIVAILEDPAGNLERIRGYVTESLRRLYNQRNQIAHSGSLRSAALTATARTSFALVGAGLDRIVHAQLQADNPSTPLQLVARAETELSLLGTPGGRSPTSLLE